MAVGRPTKYDDSFIQIARNYINKCGREATELPTYEGLARTLHLDSETLREWSKATNEDGSLKHVEFSVTIKELHDKQKEQLINDGMYGGKEVNSTMAIFLLKANHGMIETERREMVGLNGSPMKIEVLDSLEDPYERLGQQAKGQVVETDPPIQDKE